MATPRLRVALALALVAGAIAPAAARGEGACAPTSRPAPSNPLLVFQRAAFGFHDEEALICSPGYQEPIHIAARLWVPAPCQAGQPGPATGGCPGVLIAHGFGVSKEATFGDMFNLAQRGLYVLSYDVRGQGASGGQSNLMGREEIADQATVLGWFHDNVAPTKVGAYGISQGGAHAYMAAVYNCGAGRATPLGGGSVLGGGTVPSCDDGGRWVDAIAPVQGPTAINEDDGCRLFATGAIVQSRGDAEIATGQARCLAYGTPAQGPVDTIAGLSSQFELAVRNYLDKAGLVDVPVYSATSTFDRLVYPNNVIALYEALSARAADPTDPYDEDVRLLISNDAHGTIGGNFAALGDVFDWLEWQLADGGAGAFKGRTSAPVTLAQEWDGDTFRLESGWPVPGSATYYLSRSATNQPANGALTGSPPGDEPSERLAPAPFVSSAPEVPFLNAFPPLSGSRGIDGLSMAFGAEPVAAGAPMEVTGIPHLSLWVSSSNADGQGQARLHAALSEVNPDGEVSEFSRNWRRVTGLGPAPKLVDFDLTVASRRIDPGNRLMLTITASDATILFPLLSTDTTFVHHGGAHASSIVVPTVDPARAQPAGTVPSGPRFPQDGIEVFCQFGFPCP